jgi:hypothetical protein
VLIIREKQRIVLAEESFTRWLVDHARRFFAPRCLELGPDGTVSFVKEVVGRARRHGLTEGPDICGFVDLAFTFGGDFDRAVPWAQAILAEAGERASAVSMERLYEAAMAELDPNGTVARDDDDDEALTGTVAGESDEGSSS